MPLPIKGFRSRRHELEWKRNGSSAKFNLEAKANSFSTPFNSKLNRLLFYYHWLWLLVSWWSGFPHGISIHTCKYISGTAAAHCLPVLEVCAWYSFEQNLVWQVTRSFSLPLAASHSAYSIFLLPFFGQHPVFIKWVLHLCPLPIPSRTFVPISKIT